MRLGGDDLRGRYEPIGMEGGGAIPAPPAAGQGGYFSVGDDNGQQYIDITPKGKSLICSIIGVLCLVFFAWLWTVHFQKLWYTVALNGFNYGSNGAGVGVVVWCCRVKANVNRK